MTTKEEYAALVQEYLKMFSQHDTSARIYLERGGCRNVKSLTEKEQEKAERLIEMHDLQVKQCWWNCQLVAGAYPEFKYVEGYTISESAPVPIHHAWVEHKGKVWELTRSHGESPRVYSWDESDEAC